MDILIYIYKTPKINLFIVVLTQNNLWSIIPNINKIIMVIMKFKLNIFAIIKAPIIVPITSTIAKFINRQECAPSLGFPKISLRFLKGQFIFINKK